jgi:Pre ATP-grasp domain
MDIDEPPLSLPIIPQSSVYIFNLSEDVWPFISAMSDKHRQKLEIEENADLGDRDLFSFCAEESMIFVLPRPVDQAFFDYFTTLFGKRNFRILVPKSHSGVICEDIMHDENIMQALVDAANGSRRLVVKGYSTSQPFLDLVRTLRERGLTIFTPEAPEEEDAWTVNFFGSKSGIRQLSQQSRAIEPDFIMADGIVVSGIVDASRIAANKYVSEHGVVIKTNKGHSGAGVLLLREGELPNDYSQCQKAILAKLEKDEYWKLFPIVIESLISVNPSVGGGFPSVEFQVQKNGHVEFLYFGGMRVTKDGVFLGMEIHNSAISEQAAVRMVDTGFFIGEQYRTNGYRGYFDVDFVAAKNGQVYVTESNVRRTGGTHVFATAERLFGKDFMYLTYVLSNNAYKLTEDKIYTFNEILAVLAPVLFNKQTREGLIIISENLLSYHQLGYIIFGKTEKRAREIEDKMIQLLAAS